jgi:hypothetical protein
MNIKGILFVVVVIILLYVVIRYIAKDTNTLSGNVASATTMQTINASSLPTIGSGSQASNFSYSVWFYVQDWNYKYGEPKVLFGRMGSGVSSSAMASTTQTQSLQSIGTGPCPLVTFGPVQNNLEVTLSVYPSSGISSQASTFTCGVQNVPIQKWVNLLVSVYGRSLDIYLDGKLVKTCVLPGIAKINNSSNIYLTPRGGFSGWTSKFQYFPNATDPQTAWNIYQRGYGGSWLSGLFSNYQLQLSFLQNGTTTSTLTI